MKRAIAKILILAIALFSKKSDCQNLIPNYSFEIIDSCPSGLGQLSLAAPWFQPQFSTLLGTTPAQGSSDLFNACSSITSMVNVPNTSGGYQLANNGSGFSGIMFYSGSSGSGAREYVEVKLLQPLQFGKKYCLEFYVSLADSSAYGISDIAAYFSNDSLLYDSTFLPPIPVSPQIKNDTNNIISDKNNWTLISGYFVANGGEQFITIGNYELDANSHYQYLGGSINFAYYFIDDVSVVCCDCEEPNNDIFIPNAFSPNGDGVNDRLRVLGNAKKIEFKVFDRWGEMVYSYTGGEMNAEQGWDGTYKGKALDNAVFVYFAKVTLPDGTEVELKGNVSLIK